MVKAQKFLILAFTFTAVVISAIYIPLYVESEADISARGEAAYHAEGRMREDDAENSEEANLFIEPHVFMVACMVLMGASLGMVVLSPKLNAKKKDNNGISKK